MDNPIKQYIQDLIIDTVTAVTHLDSTIHVASSHKKISQIKNRTQQTFYTKRLNIIKQIRRKIKIIIITKADKGRTVVVIDKDVYR